MPSAHDISETPREDGEKLSVIAVLGSVTASGRLHTALTQALERVEQHRDAQTRLIDLAELEIAFADGRSPQQLGDDTAGVIELLGAADVVLFATPVYRGSLTGALKNLLDHIPVETLEGKATAIVAMGHTLHHFLGAERHLRDILAFFGAVVAPVACYLCAEDFSDGLPGPRASEELDLLLSDTIELSLALRTRRTPPALRPLAARPRPKS
jgi:FMN reductase